jgi:hypothetical protein
MPLIALLTDFGWKDPYVGEMKGVLLKLAPGAAIVDLTHGVARGNVREAAWILAKSWRFFPEGACHLAVVDPGVGGSRRPLAASAGGHIFVGPDNGILMPAISSAGSFEIREITWRELEVLRRGTTFDGRDLFAPAAARLMKGAPFAQVGPEVEPIRLAPFAPVPRPGGFEVEIIRADHFGNLVTIAEESFLRDLGGDAWRELRVRAGDCTIFGIRSAYEDVGKGEPLLTIGSAGTLEISVREGSAAARLELDAGAKVFLEDSRRSRSG